MRRYLVKLCFVSPISVLPNDHSLGDISHNHPPIQDNPIVSMSVVHIVLFKLKSSLTDSEVTEVGNPPIGITILTL